MSDRSAKSRLSARRKAEVVVRVMRGEEVAALSRKLQVPAHQIARWREEFLSAGTEALKARTARDEDRLFNTSTFEIKLSTMMAELAKSDGRRAFHPVRAVLGDSSRLT